MTREEAIEAVLPKLIEHYRPERVYLYGSTARGDFREDSDIDVMVLVPDAARKPQEGPNLPRTPYSFGVNCWQARAFDRQLPLKASFPAAIVREGRLLYDELRLASEIAREWLRKAARDLRSAEGLLPLGEFGNAAYFCQQAAEKAAKAYLTYLNRPFPKTHELKELANLIALEDEEMAAIARNADELSSYAWVFRYPGEPDPPAEVAIEAIALARQVYEAVLARVPKEAHP